MLFFSQPKLKTTINFYSLTAHVDTENKSKGKRNGREAEQNLMALLGGILSMGMGA